MPAPVTSSSDWERLVGLELAPVIPISYWETLVGMKPAPVILISYWERLVRLDLCTNNLQFGLGGTGGAASLHQ